MSEISNTQGNKNKLRNRISELEKFIREAEELLRQPMGYTQRPVLQPKIDAAKSEITFIKDTLRELEYEPALTRLQHIKSLQGRTAIDFKLMKNEYASLADIFDGLKNYKDSAKYLSECNNGKAEYKIKLKEALSENPKAKKRERLIKIGIFLQAALTLGYLYLLWGTNIIHTTYDVDSIIMKILPFGCYCLILGIFSLMFHRESDDAYGEAIFGIIVGIAQTITVFFWGFGIWDTFIALLLNILSCLPGLIVICITGSIGEKAMNSEKTIDLKGKYE